MKHIKIFKIFENENENEIDWVGQRAFDYYSHRIDIDLIIREYRRLIENNAPLGEIRKLIHNQRDKIKDFVTNDVRIENVFRKTKFYALAIDAGRKDVIDYLYFCYIPAVTLKYDDISETEMTLRFLEEYVENSSSWKMSRNEKEDMLKHIQIMRTYPGHEK